MDAIFRLRMNESLGSYKIKDTPIHVDKLTGVSNVGSKDLPSVWSCTVRENA